MGVELRSGENKRYVRFGGLTVKDGEAVVIWNHDGVHRQVIGPKRVYLCRSIVCFLERHKAESHQYLRVRYQDGRIEKLRGPCFMYENPALHEAITVHNGIHLKDCNDCLVVYTKETIQDQKLSGQESGIEATNNKRICTVRVIRGPALFIPKDGEFLHQFSWSIPVPNNNKNGGIIEKKSNFYVLQTDCSRLWKIQLNIVTADMAKCQVVLAFNYQIKSLAKCVVSKDPIKSMYASVIADAQSIGKRLSSYELRPGPQQKAVVARLSRTKNYPSLCETATSCGLHISSISVIKLSYSPVQRRSVVESDNRKDGKIVEEKLSCPPKLHQREAQEPDDQKDSNIVENNFEKSSAFEPAPSNAIVAQERPVEAEEKKVRHRPSFERTRSLISLLSQEEISLPKSAESSGRSAPPTKETTKPIEVPSTEHIHQSTLGKHEEGIAIAVSNTVSDKEGKETTVSLDNSLEDEIRCTGKGGKKNLSGNNSVDRDRGRSRSRSRSRRSSRSGRSSRSRSRSRSGSGGRGRNRSRSRRRGRRRSRSTSGDKKSNWRSRSLSTSRDKNKGTRKSRSLSTSWNGSRKRERTKSICIHQSSVESRIESLSLPEEGFMEDAVLASKPHSAPQTLKAAFSNTPKPVGDENESLSLPKKLPFMEDVVPASNLPVIAQNTNVVTPPEEAIESTLSLESEPKSAPKVESKREPELETRQTHRSTEEGTGNKANSSGPHLGEMVLATETGLPAEAAPGIPLCIRVESQAGESAISTLKTDSDIASILAKLQEAEATIRKREKQLAQAGVAVAEDISYDEAQSQIEKIAKRMNEIGGSDVTSPDKKEQSKLREEYFTLEQKMEKYHSALMVTDEYQIQQDKREQQWENDNEEKNRIALENLWRHMPVGIRKMSEKKLTNSPSPNGKFLPKAIAQKFRRTNVLMLLRINPEDIERMHPSMLENLRVTGLTLTERRALHCHLKVLGPKWKQNKSDKMTERKWKWYEMMKGNFKESLDQYLRHVEKYGPPGNHPYATRDNPNVGCKLIGKQCPIKADMIIDYSGDYGWPAAPEFELSEVRKASVDSSSATEDANILKKEKKANERSALLKKHYKGLLLVAKANGSCEAMDESMDKMETSTTKWVENAITKKEFTDDDKRKEVGSFVEALNLFKLALLDFVQRSGIQTAGKKKKSGGRPDERSSVECALSEEVYETFKVFSECIKERTVEMDVKDVRVKKTIELLESMLAELHERNIETLKKLGIEQPSRSRRLKSLDAIKREVKRGRKLDASKESITKEETAQGPSKGEGGRANLLSAIQGSKGRGRGGKGGRGSLMDAIKNKGRGSKGDVGGRAVLLSAIQARSAGDGAPSGASNAR